MLPRVTRYSLGDLSPEWAFGGATGKGVRVAIVDSGVEADHPDLDGSVAAAQGAAVEIDDSGNLVLVRGAHDDSFGHGTACAGIVHAIAPKAEIVSIKIFGRGLTGQAAAFEKGLSWAVAERFDVINLSLGAMKREWALPFHDLCDQAYFSGSFVVTAAGNTTRPSYPSLYASVASVACNLSADPYRFHFNPEPPTEFLARGVNVTVPWKGGGRTTVTGNSFAAPHISGLVALIKSKHPRLRPFQIKTALWATAANIQEAPEMEAGRVSRVMRAGSTARNQGSHLR